MAVLTMIVLLSLRLLSWCKRGGTCSSGKTVGEKFGTFNSVRRLGGAYLESTPEVLLKGARPGKNVA